MFFFIFSLISIFAINLGSNHVFYETGNYIGNYSEQEWRSGNMKPLVATYHLNPEKVKKQFLQIYNSGQKEISLMLWYSRFNEGNQDRLYLHHMINNKNGKMPEQVVQNLKDIVLNLEKIGFTKINIRFAQQWLSDPTTWKRWDLWYKSDEKIYNNWSFIKDGIKSVESLGLKQSLITYDLGAELGGLTKGKNIRYTKTIWQLYLSEFSIHKTYGFSFAYWPGRIIQMYKTYNKTGVTPESIALDIYGYNKNEIYQHLKQIAFELKQVRQPDLPIIIQETYYNDKQTIRQILKAKNDFNLNIQAIHQWPIERDKQANGAKHITINVPNDVSQYKKELAACKLFF